MRQALFQTRSLLFSDETLDEAGNRDQSVAANTTAQQAAQYRHDISAASGCG